MGLVTFLTAGRRIRQVVEVATHLINLARRAPDAAAWIQANPDEAFDRAIEQAVEYLGLKLNAKETAEALRQLALQRALEKDLGPQADRLLARSASQIARIGKVERCPQCNAVLTIHAEKDVHAGTSTRRMTCNACGWKSS